MADFKILVVDDEAEFRNAYNLILSDKGFRVSVAVSGEQCLDMLENESFDLVLTDLKMEGMDGLELLEQIKALEYDCEVMMVTGYGTIDSAVLAIKNGAFGYYVKGEDPDILLSEIQKIVQIKKLKADNASIRYGLKNPDYLLSTKNKRFQELLAIAEKSAASNSNILILGESGTGKEVMAKYIHGLSSRSANAFIPVSCQLFSEGILESELFGHEKGSFTGAYEKRIGRFEEANQGTLFLDEIGEVPLNTQIKLLRVLESRCFERIGSSKSIHTDIRLISATNQKLNEEIKKGLFREDLFYRINTITLHIPPLRERKEDLESLIDFFLIKFEKEMKKKILYREDGLMDILMGYDYYGNIRELRNIIERLVVLSDDSFLRIRHLPDHMLINKTAARPKSQGVLESLKDIRCVAEASHIMKALEQCNGNISMAARVLGISRRQLFNKITEYGIQKHN